MVRQVDPDAELDFEVEPWVFFGSELIRKRFFTMVIEVYRGYIMLYLYMYGLYMVISVNIS